VHKAATSIIAARVRTQVSAAHSREDLEFAVKAFAEANEELK
jgi:glycine C-acetyltransferase